MTNLVSNRLNLIDVTMPLVRLMCVGGVSWHNRHEISDAIRECTRHWQSIEGERIKIEQGMACGQQPPSGEAKP